jgi:predicted ATPase/DNA-binding CsgD family transcriptional regulator
MTSPGSQDDGLVTRVTVGTSDSTQARLVPFPGPRQDRRSGNVPLALTSLIGRDDDIDGVSRALDEHRLVTLVGPGGVGKTRLALEIGRMRQRRHPDGAWFIDLSPQTDASLVPSAFATALGVQETAGRPSAETLVDALVNRDLLLIVDNCEHLIDASARLLELLLRSCPHVAVLATSREPLAIAGELVWQVAPLASPPQERMLSVTQLHQLPSVRLFVERAAAGQSGFRLSEQNADGVAQICRRLDGLPLALELAAARVSSMTVEQIAARLDDRFRLLTTGSRTAPPRQQTLLALLDWSFALLSEPERAALRQASVFVNGWTLPAAERVLTAGPMSLDLLGQLIARSLVRFDQFAQRETARAPAPRYRLLETVRQYASERLQEADEVEPTRLRHTMWCIQLAEEAEPHLLGREQLTWLLRLDQEYDNIRAALGWCLEHDPSLGLRLAARLWQFWRVRLHLSEGRHWLESLLARTPEPSLPRAQALVGTGILANWQLDSGTALTHFEDGLALARELGDQRLTGRALRELGGLTAFQFGDHTRAWALFQEAVECSRAAGDQRSVGTTLLQQGRLAAAEGDFRRARAFFDESVAVLADVGDQWQLSIALEDAGGMALLCGEPDAATVLLEDSLAAAEAIEAAGLTQLHRRYHLGTVAYWRGDAESAVAWYEQGLALMREREHAAGIADNLAGLGQAVLLQGDVERATALLQESLRLYDERASSSGTGLALYALGLAAWQAGDPALALTRLRESLMLRQRTNQRPGIAECLEALALVTASQAGSVKEARRAIRWLGAADALRDLIGAPRPPVDRPRYDAAIAAAEVWLDNVTVEVLIGTQQPLDAVVADALPDAPGPELAADVRDTTPKGGGEQPSSVVDLGAYPAGLSAREVEVLRLIAAGRTNAEIAQVLVVSANTIRHHVTHILDKTGCENRAAATAFALRHNLA